MDHLWSPWRYRYVSQAPDDSTCIFCDKGSDHGNPENQARDHENLVVFRGRHCFVLLNLYPYSTGHLMIAPYAHVAELSAVSADAWSEIMQMAQKSERVLQQVYRPEGMNLGINLGKAAGAGVAGHIHVHILPRWSADANFMSTVGETRVLPEDLRTTYDKVLPMFRDQV